jgi:hypothetical protein
MAQARNVAWVRNASSAPLTFAVPVQSFAVLGPDVPPALIRQALSAWCVV